MSDLDLLPDWYRKLRRSRRRLAIGACIAGAALAAMVGVGAALQRAIGSAETRLSLTSAKLSSANADVENLGHLAHLRDAMLAGHAQLWAIGRHAPASWLLAQLDRASPPRISLTDLNLDPTEPTTNPSDPTEIPPASHVVLRGLAASDADVAAMQEALTRIPGVSAVSIGNAKDLAVAGRVLRAFEIGFEFSDPPGDSVAEADK